MQSNQLKPFGRFGAGEEDSDLTSLLDPVLSLMGLLAVMVVLLPTFHQIGSRLTEAQGEPLARMSEEAVVLRFAKENELHWNDEPIDFAQLEVRVAEHSNALNQSDSAEGRAAPTVLLAGEESASYGLSLKIRSLLGKHGVPVKELSRAGKE